MDERNGPDRPGCLRCEVCNCRPSPPEGRGIRAVEGIISRRITGYGDIEQVSLHSECVSIHVGTCSPGRREIGGIKAFNDLLHNSSSWSCRAWFMRAHLGICPVRALLN